MHALRILFLALVITLAVSACEDFGGERGVSAKDQAAQGSSTVGASQTSQRLVGPDMEFEIGKDYGSMRVTMKGDDGDVKIATGSEASMPVSFPKDIWVPSSFELQSTMEEGGRTVLQLDVKDENEFSEIAARSSRAMYENGWTERLRVHHSGERRHVMDYQKGQRRSSISIYPNKPGLRVQLTAE